MSGGGGSETTTTATTQNYSPEEAAQRAKVQAEAARIYGATAPTISSASYPGAQVTPFSAETIAAQNLAEQTAGQQQAGVGLMNQGLEYGLNGAMDVANNPYLQSAISAALRPVTQSYVDPGGVLSSIRTNATDAGQFGGIRQGMAEASPPGATRKMPWAWRAGWRTTPTKLARIRFRARWRLPRRRSRLETSPSIRSPVSARRRRT